MFALVINPAGEYRFEVGRWVVAIALPNSYRLVHPESYGNLDWGSIEHTRLMKTASPALVKQVVAAVLDPKVFAFVAKVDKNLDKISLPVMVPSTPPKVGHCYYNAQVNICDIPHLYASLN